MDKKAKTLSLLIVLLSGIFFLQSASWTEAQLSDMTLDQVQAQQSDLQKQLQAIEKQITQYQKDLKKIQGQKNTLTNKIAALKKQEQTLLLQLKATAMEVEFLDAQIGSTELSITQNESDKARLTEQLGNLMRLIYKIDNYSILYPFLVSHNFSDIFQELENYYKISQGLNDIVSQIKTINQKLDDERTQLAAQQDSAEKLLSIQTLQKHNIDESVVSQSTLLKQTKGKESNYQTMLSDSKKKAQEIRTRLYSLLEVEKQINFGQAVAIAQWASSQTGVRAAFLLAILTQESNLGRNVGTCNRAGDPPSKSYKVIMHPTRDIPHFLTITSELGRNADVTPVSCPMRDKYGKQVGWGGAMGPAQFIPSTWMGYRGKVAAITGKSADPWDIRDAFLASAIKLAADGGTTKSGEWAAAMKYFSGSTNTKYRFYGDSVVAQAEKYQDDIDQLNK